MMRRLFSLGSHRQCTPSKEQYIVENNFSEGGKLYFLNLSDFPEDTCILLEENTRETIFSKLEEKYGSLGKARKELSISGSSLYSWKNGFELKKHGKVNRFIPLNSLKKVCCAIDLQVNSLQNQVEEIKANSRAGVIRGPQLPLKIIPGTFAVLGYFLSDGYGGERGNASYVSKSPEARDNFIAKLKASFGDADYLILEKHWRVIVAKIVPKILKKYFQIPDFRTGKVIFPESMFDYQKPCLIELLKAMIIDEGRINDNGIAIEYSPKSCLTEVAKRLCKILGYNIQNYKHAAIISPKSFPQVKEDMGDFVIPSKQADFTKYFKKNKRGWYNQASGVTRTQILELLSKRNYSIKGLGAELNIGTGAVRDQVVGYTSKGARVKGLLESGIIEVKPIGWRTTRIFGIKS